MFTTFLSSPWVYLLYTSKPIKVYKCFKISNYFNAALLENVFPDSIALKCCNCNSNAFTLLFYQSLAQIGSVIFEWSRYLLLVTRVLAPAWQLFSALWFYCCAKSYCLFAKLKDTLAVTVFIGSIGRITNTVS